MLSYPSMVVIPHAGQLEVSFLVIFTPRFLPPPSLNPIHTRGMQS